MTESDNEVPESLWANLNHVRRLVGMDDGKLLRWPVADFAEGARLVVLLQYEDVFGETWDVWRIFTKKLGSARLPERDGEQRGYKRNKRKHFSFLSVNRLTSLLKKLRRRRGGLGRSR
jgi:hypothetical protein